MPLISMRQLLDHAAEHSYGVPAFNVNNMEQIKAIMGAAQKTKSPVILQGSAGARKYAGEPFLRHLVAAAVEAYPDLPIVMHQDHGASPDVCMGEHAVGVSVEAELGCLGSLETRGGPLRRRDAMRCAGDRHRHLAWCLQV